MEVEARGMEDPLGLIQACIELGYKEYKPVGKILTYIDNLQHLETYDFAARLKSIWSLNIASCKGKTP